MGENSKIEWTDHTFNPWVGCTRISPACDFCYAETWARRTGQGGLWAGERRHTSPAVWKQPLKWNEEARLTGYSPWVFCASLADVFDNEVPDEWRRDLWDLIEKTPLLRWQLLTKRIGNAGKMLPDLVDLGRSFPQIGVMATIANQEEAGRDLPKLLRLKQHRNLSWVGISYEPALGPLDLYNVVDGAVAELDWVIAGGESGPNARPSDPSWFREIRDQCADMRIPFLFKQWGQFDADGKRHKRKEDAGRLLDGVEHNGMPRTVAQEEAA